MKWKGYYKVTLKLTEIMLNNVSELIRQFHIKNPFTAHL